MAISESHLIQTLVGTPYLLDDASVDRVKHIETLLKTASQIQRLYDEVKETLRPIVRQTPEFQAYQTYNSNKLELQGPDLERTKEIIEQLTRDKVPDDLRVLTSSLAVSNDTHMVEVVGVHSAYQLAERIASDFTSEVPFTVSDLRQLNAFCIPTKHFAGKFRTSDAINLGQFFDTNDPLWFDKPLDRPVEVSWLDVPRHMQELCEYISKRHPCAPLAAAAAHAWFTHTHPFLDGNGRVARVLANIILLRHDWPPMVILKDAREEYLDALEESDGGRIQPLFDLFLNYIEIALKYLSDKDYFLPLYQLENREPTARFAKWNEQAGRFMDLLRRELDRYGWSLDRVQLPSSTTFFLLEDGVPGAASLLGRARHPDGRAVRIGLGYMSERMQKQSSREVLMDGHHYPPTIYFQERNFFPGAPYPYVHRNDSSLRLREITFSTLAKEPCFTLVRTANDRIGRPNFQFHIEASPSLAALASQVANAFEHASFQGR